MKPVDWVRPPVFFAALAAWIGLGAALAEVRLHGYAELSFERNLALLLQGSLLRWSAGGALVGAAYAALRVAGGAAWRLFAGRERGARIAALTALGTGVALALVVLLPMDAAQRWIVAAGALLWCAVAALAEAGGPAPLRRALRFGAAALPPLVACSFLEAPYRLAELFRRPEVLVACALALGLVLLCLALPRRGAGEAAEDADPLGGPGVGWLLAAWLLPAAAGLWSTTLSPQLVASNPKNVLLIAVDTLRLDHTSLGEDDRATAPTPQLGAWADGGTRFTAAVSQAPWTLPAFASVMTGRYPRQHGAVSLFGRLRPSETTLAEALREAGYWTGGVVSHLFVDADHGFAQGFDHYDSESSLGHHEITSERVTRRALELLDAHRQDRFFLFLHYFDPHYEFRDHPDRDQADGYAGWLREVTDIGDLRSQRHLLGPEEVGFLKHLYDEEIAHTDAQIGRVLERLDALGLSADTAVVFVADHGEEFMERGWLGHTVHLHDELVRVPLAMVLPGVEDAPSRVAQPVETRAVFATLLDYLGVASPALDTGASLLPVLEGAAAPVAVFSEVWLPDAPVGSGKRVRVSSVRTGDWKLVLDHERGRVSLYDLAADPAETRDVSGRAPEAYAELQERLGRWLADMGEPVEVPSAEPDAELREQLRALGYVD